MSAVKVESSGSSEFADALHLLSCWMAIPTRVSKKLNPHSPRVEIIEINLRLE
jgi:hypothetical protein